jgi:hypothetical protein
MEVEPHSNYHIINNHSWKISENAAFKETFDAMHKSIDFYV